MAKVEGVINGCVGPGLAWIDTNKKLKKKTAHP